MLNIDARLKSPGSAVILVEGKLSLHVRLRLKIDPTALPAFLPKSGSSAGEAVGSIFSLNLTFKESLRFC